MSEKWLPPWLYFMRQCCIAVGTTLALVMLLSLVRLGTPAHAANQGMAEVLGVTSVAARSAEQQAASTTALLSAGSSEPQADQAEVSPLTSPPSPGTMPASMLRNPRPVTPTTPWGGCSQ